MYDYYGVSEGASAGSNIISIILGLIMIVSYVFIFF